jgi:hypothetical protein
MAGPESTLARYATKLARFVSKPRQETLGMVRQNVGDASITYIKGHFPGSITSDLGAL